MSSNLKEGDGKRADMMILGFSMSSLPCVDTWMTLLKRPTSLLLEPSKCVRYHSTLRFEELREPN